MTVPPAIHLPHGGVVVTVGVEEVFKYYGFTALAVLALVPKDSSVTSTLFFVVPSYLRLSNSPIQGYKSL